MGDNKISVIMSVFNAEKYLVEALDSILNQTYSHFEFIIIEDASTDNSLQILKEYRDRDPRILLIENNVNRGAAGFIKNLNVGLEKATGNYIARMDADDISDLKRFEKQIRFFTENPDIFIVGSTIQLIDETGAPVKLLSPPVTNQDIRRSMPKRISLFHPVIMWRNNKKIFYREKMVGCEDYDLYFRLMTSGYNFGNINESLLKYRILENSISRKDNKLIKWLFVEKSREFYHERKRKNTDSYNSFEPEIYLNILNPEYKNSIKDLLFAAKIASKYRNFEALAIILSKAKRQFPNEKRFFIFNLYLKYSKNLFPKIQKFPSK